MHINNSAVLLYDDVLFRDCLTDDEKDQWVIDNDSRDGELFLGEEGYGRNR